MIIDKERIGEYFTVKRIESGMSQLELARKIGYSSPQYVSNWERAVCGPPIEKLALICKFLKIEPLALMDLILEDQKHYLIELLKLKKIRNNF